MKAEKIKHLGLESRIFYEEIKKEYGISDAAGLKLLRTAAECLDMMRKCEKVLEKEGLSIRDRWGVPKPHPITTTLRDVRSQFLMSLKHLNLDLEPLGNVGRPAGGQRYSQV